MPSFFAPVHLLSLLDDVIPDWDLRERKERKALTTTAANPSKKSGSSVVVGLRLRFGRGRGEREKLAESSADNASSSLPPSSRERGDDD